MQCMKYVEPLNPEVDCKYGYERNICNKTSCLKGPDEPCFEEWGLMGGRCAGNLMCCGYCIGCLDRDNCSKGMCHSSSKRVPSSLKPLWLTEYYYKQKLEERRRLQQNQLQQQQPEERQRNLMQSPRNFINSKSPVYRLPSYPFMNNFDYLTNNGD